MNLKRNILTALLIAIGFILHQIVPGLLGGMKFDFMLSLLFASILINRELKNAMLGAILGGIISAMTTTFPGGQIPNMIDKFITCLLVYLMTKACGKYAANVFVIGIITFIGTLISGSVFLGSASFIAGLPESFTALFILIVVPATVANMFITIFAYRTVLLAIRTVSSKAAEQ